MHCIIELVIHFSFSFVFNQNLFRLFTIIRVLSLGAKIELVIYRVDPRERKKHEISLIIIYLLCCCLSTLKEHEKLSSLNGKKFCGDVITLGGGCNYT